MICCQMYLWVSFVVLLIIYHSCCLMLLNPAVALQQMQI
uniref:Uncharacterized protein n=1 Tax=Arundo donax TaxID=35708 RepID=A0A0A9GE94_ARUDO